MLKMSYREKVVALVLIVLVIILIFVMAPIKMIRQNIKEDTKTMETVKVDYDENNRKINEIPGIEANINKIYDESKDLNKDFSAHLENVQIDEYIQSILNNDKYKKDGKFIMKIEGAFDMDDPETSNLEFYFYGPEVLEYPILENADTNGTLLKDTDPSLFEKFENAVYMSKLESQMIEKHSASFTASFTKEGLFQFIDQLKDENKGVRITSLSIDSYRFGNMKTDELQRAIDAADLKGYTTGTFDLEFYTMQQIQKPVLD